MIFSHLANSISDPKPSYGWNICMRSEIFTPNPTQLVSIPGRWLKSTCLMLVSALPIKVRALPMPNQNNIFYYCLFKNIPPQWITVCPIQISFHSISVCSLHKILFFGWDLVHYMCNTHKKKNHNYLIMCVFDQSKYTTTQSIHLKSYFNNNKQSLKMY